MSEQIDSPVQILLERFRAHGVGRSDEINPFWKGQLGRFEALLGTGEATPRLIQEALGYSSGFLENGASNTDAPHWPILMRAVDTGDMDGLQSKAFEHVATLHFFREQGLLDAYVAWADGQGLVTDMGLARMYWYSLRLRRLLAELKRPTPQVFLEVGPGSGRFALIMAQAGLVSHYVLVDLPEMLLNAMLHVEQILPDASIRLGVEPDFSQPGMTFWCLETRDIEKAPAASIDIAVNFNSFMEMDEDIRDFYISQIYRAAAPRCLFYNVNRRQASMTRRDGTRYENNPLLYPYRPTDRVIEWSPDECQENSRSRNFVAPVRSFSISRIAEIGGG